MDRRRGESSNLVDIKVLDGGVEAGVEVVEEVDHLGPHLIEKSWLEKPTLVLSIDSFHSLSKIKMESQMVFQVVLFQLNQAPAGGRTRRTRR